MSVFFNGRLIVSPTSASNVDDSAMANKNLSVGNVLALVGQSTGGAPNTPLVFGNAQDAKATLISGELLDAVIRAFDPSAEVTGPSEIVAIRVNPAVQAALTLLDTSSAPVINLLSTDYGLYTNQIKAKIETASGTGKKLTVQLGSAYYSADNVLRNAMSLQYAGGAATATLTTTNSTLTLAAPAGTTVATIDLNVYKTIGQLVDRINTVSGFSAAVLDGNANKPALNGLDSVTAVDVKTSLYTVMATLQACVDWFNTVAGQYVTASRVANAGTLPANIGFTYLSGGSDGVTTNTNWSNAYTALQLVDAQWVVPVNSNPAIHAMNDAHCTYMSNIGKMERRGIVGAPLGTTDAIALGLAKAINSDRTSLVHIGMYDYDANGNWTLYPPYILAAMVAGGFAGSNPGTPMTNKSLKVKGLERSLRNPTDTDPLIQGGVLCVENTKTGYRVVQSITTWLTNDNYNRVEVSTGCAVDYAVRSVREALDVLRGQKGSPLTLARAVSIAESTLRELSRAEPQGPGVLVGDKDNPPYKNIQATLQGDVVRVQYLCQPAIGVNYVLSTCFAQPYSGSASA